MSTTTLATKTDDTHTERSTKNESYAPSHTETVPAEKDDPISSTESSPRASIKDDAVLEASRLADLEAPDGGRGWVVILGCSVLTYWFIGTSYSWGVIQTALVEEGVGSAASLSWVGSIATSLGAAMALITAKLNTRLSSRYTCLIGVTFIGLGEILASFTVHNVGGLFVTAGVLFGIGNGLLFMVCSCLITRTGDTHNLLTGHVYAIDCLCCASAMVLQEAWPS